MTPRERKRFYEKVAIALQDGRFAILLDGKKVKTPARGTLALPTQGLAEAVVAEWCVQGERILLQTMPFTRLANTAIDRIGRERTAVIAALAGFGAYDLLCYRSEDKELALREGAGWDPLLAWAQHRYGARFRVTMGIAPVEQPAAGALGSALAGYDDFTLTGLSTVVTITGSLVLGLALVEGRIDRVSAFALSRIDEAYQAEKWGMDAEAEARASALERELACAAALIAFARS